MRFLSSFSASLLLLAASGSAFAASAPRSFVEVGSFSPASVKPLAVDADASSLEVASRLVIGDRAPWSSKLSLGPSRLSSLSDGRRIVKLAQMHKGLPVLHRGATVSFGADGVAHVVAAKLTEELPEDVTPAVAVADAAQTATKISGVEMAPESGKLVIWPSADGNVLAWHFYSPALGTIPYAPAVVVDAKTGELIVRYNAAVSVHQAQVYPTNPVKSPQLQTVTLPLPDGATTLSNPLIKAANCIDKKTTKSIMGFSIHTCELLQTAVADPNTLDFNVPPGGDTDAEDPFAELHIFTHTQKAYDFFHIFDPSFKVQAAPLDAVANLRVPQGLDTFDLAKMGNVNLPLAPFQNAFFSPGGAGDPFSLIFGLSGASMMFGQGPLRDYSYDGDVIYHEFTHAVVNATIALVATPHNDAHGVSVSPGAMNEGLADYFSSALAGDPDVGEYASKDIDPSLTAIRSLANPDSCPGSIGVEVHQDATLFSGALWDVRKGLPAAKQAEFDLAVFAAMNAAPSGDLGYEDFAKVIGAQVETSAALGAPVKMALDQAFTKRGVLPQCTRILDYQGSTMVGPMPIQTQGGGSLGVWLSLGTASVNVGTNKLGYAAGGTQIKITLPANTDSLSIDFQAAATGGGGFGGGGTFTPKAIVRFGADPIQFTYGPFATTPDVVALDTTGGGQGLAAYSATTPVAPGTTTAYVMIVNGGDADGLFTNINFTTTQSAGSGSGGSGQGGEGGAGVGGSGTGANSAGPAVEDAGGCGCAVPGDSNVPAGASIAALAGLVGLLSRRRRK